MIGVSFCNEGEGSGNVKTTSGIVDLVAVFEAILHDGISVFTQPSTWPIIAGENCTRDNAGFRRVHIAADRLLSVLSGNTLGSLGKRVR